MTQEDKNPNNPPVGPQKYDPNYFYSQANKHAKIGTSERDGMKPNLYTPAANAYTLKGDFDKAQEKP